LLLVTEKIKVKTMPDINQSLYAHERLLAQGDRPLPKTIRQAINKAAHRQGAEHETAVRQQMLDQARSMLTDGLIVDDVLAGLGLSNA
jgi:hypothetical protein